MTVYKFIVFVVLLVGMLSVVILNFSRIGGQDVSGKKYVESRLPDQCRPPFLKSS